MALTENLASKRSLSHDGNIVDDANPEGTIKRRRGNLPHESIALTLLSLRNESPKVTALPKKHSLDSIVTDDEDDSHSCRRRRPPVARRLSSITRMALAAPPASLKNAIQKNQAKKTTDQAVPLPMGRPLRAAPRLPSQIMPSMNRAPQVNSSCS